MRIDSSSKSKSRLDDRGSTRSRSLTVLDLAVLIVGVALGLVWYRTVHPQLDRSFASPAYASISQIYATTRRVVEYGFPFFAGIVMVMPILRFLPPCPPWRQIRRQRGWTACLAATGFFASVWSFLGLMWLLWWLVLSKYSPVGSTSSQFMINHFDLSFANFLPGWVVGSVWIMQRVVFKPAVATDWVDRCGRLLGWGCLVTVP